MSTGVRPVTHTALTDMKKESIQDNLWLDSGISKRRVPSRITPVNAKTMIRGAVNRKNTREAFAPIQVSDALALVRKELWAQEETFCRLSQ